MWANRERVHVELRDVDPDDLRRLAPVLERGLSELEGVRWARLHRPLRRMVIAVDRALVSPDAVARHVARIEHELGIASEPFAVRRPERFPGDAQPIRRTAFELGADLWALSMATVAKRVGWKTLPAQIDVAALVTLVENVPALRRPIEKVVGIPATEMALDLAGVLTRVLLQAQAGSVAETVQRALRLRELIARRRLWCEWEPTLCGDPERFPGLRATRKKSRPEPHPRGPLEDYAERATAASLGAFGLGLAASHSADSAAGAIFAGLPKPARLGREAFAAHIGARLAGAGILVVHPQILRKLERIDTVVVERALMDGAAGAAVEKAARAAGLRFCIAEGSAKKRVRRQQHKGRAVCFVGGPSSGHAVADCAVGIVGDGPAPWGAHIFCRSELGACSALATIGAARQAARYAVGLAALEAAVGMGLASAGLEEETTKRIMTASGAISILSIANGVRLARSVPVRAEPVAPPPEPPPWHSLDGGAVLARLGSGQGGLDPDEARARWHAPAPRPPGALRLARAIGLELWNPITPLLAGGAGLSALTGAGTDAALIGAVLVANAIFGGAERYQSERAIDRLATTERRRVRALRGGAPVELDASTLVPGDVIQLEAGDVVPADARLLDAPGLEVDESALTGESLPVEKSPEPSDAAAVADRRSMIYEGTAIAAGSATAVVVAVGEDTEARRAYADVGSVETGVERRLEAITRLTGPIAIGAGAVVAGAAALRRRPLRDVASAGVSLAVAAVPEGLPLLATVSQLAAARRLSERGALVRDKRAVEALGRVDVVCADKTATLTEGRISLSTVSDGVEARSIAALGPRHRRILATALRASPAAETGSPLPHRTDQALVEGARRAGVEVDEGLSDLHREQELPFEPGRRFHAGLTRHAGGRLLSVKGAPEHIVPRCVAWRKNGSAAPLSDADRRLLVDEGNRLARRGYRVLAVAERIAHEDVAIDDERVSDLTFDGFVGLSDPVRPSAKAAVDDLRRAGITTVMVTGDHASTAEAIAAELGLGGGDVVTGPELEEMSDGALAARIDAVSVFARVTPAQKLRIVRAYQKAGHAVAMTGDGANDAPAIRLADVGIALGAESTEAARSAADVVVTDERIETLVSAVLEGRALWASVRDAVSILVGGNVGEIGFALTGGLVAGSPPLNARQLLLVNLLTDTLPALVIASGKPRGMSPEQLMREGAHTLLGRELERDIAWRAAVTGGAAGAAWLVARTTGSRRGAGTVALIALTGTQLAQTIAAGGRSPAVLATGLGSMAALAAVVQTPGLSHFFGCRPLGPLGWSQAALATAGGTAASLIAARASSRKPRPVAIAQAKAPSSGR